MRKGVFLNKRGGVMDDEMIKTILAVAVVALMIYLVFLFFSPVFNEADEGAESYFENLKDVIENADAGKDASFFMIDNGRDDLNFYLVYFGEAASFSFDGKSFRYGGKEGPNAICVCGESSEVVCGHCVGLDFSGKLAGAGDNWAIGEGRRVVVKRGGDQYDFMVK